MLKVIFIKHCRLIYTLQNGEFAFRNAREWIFGDGKIYIYVCCPSGGNDPKDVLFDVGAGAEIVPVLCKRFYFLSELCHAEPSGAFLFSPRTSHTQT